MHISILTFDGFNELDSFIAYGILNRIKKADWRVSIASPSPQVRSMNGLVIERQIDLSQACEADVVLVGSGMKTRDVAADDDIMSQLTLDPSRQLIGAQCSGALILAKLGLLNEIPACTDLTTKPWVQEAGVKVLNQAFYANKNLATAGGCLASQYLAAWVIARLEGVEAMKNAIDYVAPVGEKENYVAQTMAQIMPYLGD
ncbi:AraC family transcriptional regulator [Marinomonas sp. 42_23_T18]|nr:AraC family transcriptional regulator [Marinomonas sp. 42_23_T18]